MQSLVIESPPLLEEAAAVGAARRWGSRPSPEFSFGAKWAPDYGMRVETRWCPDPCHAEIPSTGKERVCGRPQQLGVKEWGPANSL